MNAPIPEDALARVKEAVARGQKIEAIRLYREATTAGLAEAKAAVEQLEAESRAIEPDSLAAAARTRDVRQPPARLVGGVPLGCLLGATPFVVFGAAVLVAGVRGATADWAANARAVRTPGAVVRHDNRLPPNHAHSNTQCRAVVSYEVGGQSYEVFGPIQFQPGVWGRPQAYPIGQTVTVLYDPDRPEAAAVESFNTGGRVLIVVGLTFLLLGIGLLWFERRRRRGQRERGRAETGAAVDRRRLTGSGG